MKTNRNLLKFVLLSIITLGIYEIAVTTRISEDINLAASQRDKKHTMNFLLILFIFSWLTFGIAPLVWWHRISNRIGDEARARLGTYYDFSASDFWIWCVLGSIIVVGPFIYIHKLLTAMNLIGEDYNQKGC